MWQAIRRKEGFIVLTGDIGTGKTTMCRTLLEQFDETTFTALILNPFLSVEELLREVLLSFGVVSKDALKTGRLATASKHELVRTLHDFLLSLVPLHGSAVLIIDEAQHLSSEVLEEIRVLSNLETNDQKLLQVVIVGQLNLIEMLHKPDLRQLDQRISIRCYLKPLTREEVEAYVTHRLWVARGSTPVTFTPKSVRPGAFDHRRHSADDQPGLRSRADGCLRTANQPHQRRQRGQGGSTARPRDSEGQDQGRKREKRRRRQRRRRCRSRRRRRDVCS